MLQLWNFVKIFLILFPSCRNGWSQCWEAKGISRKKDSQKGRQITCSAKKNYTKVKDLPKKELKAKREAVKSCVQKHRLSAKQLLDTSECSTLLPCSSTSSSTPEPPPFLVAMKFPKWGESSKKRKRRSDDRFYKKPAKLEKGKKALKKAV